MAADNKMKKVKNEKKIKKQKKQTHLPAGEQPSRATCQLQRHARPRRGAPAAATGKDEIT